LISHIGKAGIPFSVGSRIELNLLDPKSKGCISVAVYIAKIGIENGAWNIQLRWKDVPKLTAF
jgi:hypothetical protein